MPAFSGTTSISPALSLRTTYTTPLLAQVASGNTVQAAHYTMLKDFINAVGAHTHTLTDYSQVKEFGNLVSPGTVSTTDTVNTVSGFTAIASTFSQGGDIKASQYTEMRNQVEALRSHNHVWDDLLA
jgi:hypothetical protein